MRHRYSYLDPDLIRQLLAEMGLRRLFNHLLLQSGGDVEEAMRWMKALQERGYIDPNIDLQAFFARLVEENIIGQDANGNVVLAAGGERQIRRDALDEIFSGLQKSMSGYHSVPTAGQGWSRQPRLGRVTLCQDRPAPATGAKGDRALGLPVIRLCPRTFA